MRKRGNFVGVWMDDKELKHLKEQAETSGLSVGSLIRNLVAGVELRPRPPETYAVLLRELAAIGKNINQIAYWANARKSIYKTEIIDAAVLAKEAWRLVKDKL